MIMLLSMTHLAYLMRIFLSFAPKCWELTRGLSLKKNWGSNPTVCLFQFTYCKQERKKIKKKRQDKIKLLNPSLP